MTPPVDGEIANVDSAVEIEIVLRRKRRYCGNPGRGYRMCHNVQCECGMMMLQCSVFDRSTVPVSGLNGKTRIVVIDIKVFIRSKCC